MSTEEERIKMLTEFQKDQETARDVVVSLNNIHRILTNNPNPDNIALDFLETASKLITKMSKQLNGLLELALQYEEEAQESQGL